MSSRDSVGIKTVTSHLQQAGFPAYSIDLYNRNFPAAEGRTAQNFKHQPATKSPRAFRAHKRTCLLGHAMGLFSAGFPTGVDCAPNATSSNPTNRLPTSPIGQATKATGRLHCYICNFLRVTQGHSSVQLANRLVLSTVSRLPENTNDTHILQLTCPVERPLFLWESPSKPLQIS